MPGNKVEKLSSGRIATELINAGHASRNLLEKHLLAHQNPSTSKKEFLQFWQTDTSPLLKKSSS